MTGPYVAGLDIDGVIGDFVSSFRRLVEAEYGSALTEDDIRGHDLWLALGISKSDAVALVKRTLEAEDYLLYPGALSGLETLVQAGIEVHIITARWNGLREAAELAKAWLAARGIVAGVHYNRIDAVKEGAKYAVEAHLDCFVDDNLMELIEMAEHRTDVSVLVAYDHPWNRTIDVRGRFLRVTGWDELVHLILEGAARRG